MHLQNCFDCQEKYGSKADAWLDAWWRGSRPGPHYDSCSSRYPPAATASQRDQVVGTGAAVPGKHAGALALNIGVGTPVIHRIHLVGQQPHGSLATHVHPGLHAFLPGLDAGQAPGLHVPQQAGDRFDVVFDAARDVAQCAHRPHHHQQIRKSGVLDAVEGLRTRRPLVPQALPAGATDVDAVIGAGQRVRPVA